MAVVAIDLGGTKLAAALVTNRGRLRYHAVMALEGRCGKAVGELMRGSLRQLLALAAKERVTVTGIGVCVPGIVQDGGRVWAPNIPGWTNYPLSRELRTVVRGRSTPVIIESDRTCYILGEAWRGAARGCRDAIYLSVGTGIGVGILVNGEALRGARGSGGSIGWLALDRPFRDEYRRCGCFEFYASGAGLARHAPNLSGAELFTAYDRGDPVARAAVGQALEFWGMAVANLVSLFNPRKIIFGGGVFGPALTLLDEILLHARKWAQPVAIRQVKLEASRLGGDAGLYGAACLALRKARECS